MCLRLDLRASTQQIQQHFAVDELPGDLQPSFNIAPLQPVLAIRDDETGCRTASWMQWGLVPEWFKEPLYPQSLRASSAHRICRLPAFRDPIRKRRCLIPVTGYVLIEKLALGKVLPWHIERKSGKPFALAGVWDHWECPGSAPITSCAIVMTWANDAVGEFSNQMPIMLYPSEWEDWLSSEHFFPEDVADFDEPCPAEWLRMWPVTTQVLEDQYNSPEAVVPDQAAISELGHQVDSFGLGANGRHVERRSHKHLTQRGIGVAAR